MQQAIHRNHAGDGAACSLSGATGKNSTILRPLGQLIQSLYSTALNQGFQHAIATRAMAGELTIEFEGGIKTVLQTRELCVDLAGSRPPQLTVTTHGDEPSHLTMSVTPETLQKWIKDTAGAGCIWCGTEDASKCETCNRTKELAAT